MAFRGVAGEQAVGLVHAVLHREGAGQAEGVEALLEEQGRRMDAVLFFDVTDEEILSRLERRRTLDGRADDDPGAVAVRLRAYRDQTAPVLDWYERRGGVIRIPAVGTIEEIAGRVEEALAIR